MPTEDELLNDHIRCIYDPAKSADLANMGSNNFVGIVHSLLYEMSGKGPFRTEDMKLFMEFINSIGIEEIINIESQTIRGTLTGRYLRGNDGKLSTGVARVITKIYGETIILVINFTITVVDGKIDYIEHRIIASS